LIKRESTGSEKRLDTIPVGRCYVNSGPK
jgi:hypothetical protein